MNQPGNIKTLGFNNWGDTILVQLTITIRKLGHTLTK
jgi:hypothetical protein